MTLGHAGGYKMGFRQALELAKEYHYGQCRRGSNLPYITHPMAVAEMFDDEDYKIVAVLHDTIEDTKLTLWDLSDKHMLDMNLVLALDRLTRKEGQTYLDHLLRCKELDVSRQVKIADLNHNLSDLKPGGLRDKYIMALYILKLPYISPIYSRGIE